MTISFADTTLAAGLDKTSNVLRCGSEVHVRKTYESPSGDDDGDVILFFPIPSNALPGIGGQVLHDSITGGTDYEFGLYEIGRNGDVTTATAVDIDCFLGTTSFANTTTQDPFSLWAAVDKAHLPLWEFLGLSSDPNKLYWWGITMNTAGSGGTITVAASYLPQG